MSGRNTLVFAVGTLGSRVLGLVRDLTWVVYLPAASRDAFLVGFRFPNMLRDLIGEGAANAAFVPVFSESQEQDSEAAYRELISASLSAMLVVLAVITAVGLLLIPPILNNLDQLSVLTQREAVSEARSQQLIEISLWTFPYIFMIGLTVFCTGPLFAAGRYAVPSWSPAILNVALIVSCVTLYDDFADPAYAPVAGVWAGGIATLVVQYVAMGRASGVWLPNFKLNHPALKTIFWLLVPVILGQAAGELNKLVDLLFAASLPIGTVTVLFYANRLVQLPLSLFGVATQVAVLPALSRANARGDLNEARMHFLSALNQCLFLVLPAAVGLVVLAEPVVRMLFQYGHFSAEDTARTANALMIYAVGLSAFALVKVAVTGFYSRQNTRVPVMVASGAMLLNILLNAVLVGPLGYLGLALGTTISYAVNLGLLLVFLNEVYGGLYERGGLKAMARMAIAAAMMAAVVFGLHAALDRNLGHDTIAARIMTTVPPILAGAAAYLGLSAAMGVNEMTTFLNALRRRG